MLQPFQGFVMAIAADEELNFGINKLILGDNLEILKSMDNESVDLIYLDPPFFQIEIMK